MKIERQKQKVNIKEVLPQIIDRIFLVCKNDSSFKLKNEIDVIERKEELFVLKLSKQDDLLKKSTLLKKDAFHRIETLMKANDEKKESLLESLNSD